MQAVPAHPAPGREIRIAPGQILRFPGAALDIRPGAKVLLDFLWPGRKFWSEFVGMRQDRYVLLHPPLEPDSLEAYRRDAQATVRYVHRDYHICGFTTWVRKLAMNPAPLLFLEYPRSIEVLNMRHHERAASMLPAVLRTEGSDLAAVIVNISSGGCRAVLRPGTPGPPPQPGAEVLCTFALPGMAEGFAIPGRVRGVDEREGRTALGVSFADLDPDQKRAVEGFVSEVREYLPA